MWYATLGCAEKRVRKRKVIVVGEGQQLFLVFIGISTVGTEIFVILVPHHSFSLLPVRALASISTNSCSYLGISSTALSKVVQNACLLLLIPFCVSVGAYATENITALTRPRNSSVTFRKRSLINSGERAARVMEIFTSSSTSSCSFVSPFSPPHSPLQYTRYCSQPGWKLSVRCGGSPSVP